LGKLVGENIDIGDKEEKGIRISIDGKNYYIDLNGNYVE